MSFISFQDIRKDYTMGEVVIHALDGASFTIEEGEFVIIAGASGAGKSTILNLLGGMDHATGGTIQVAGQDLTSFSDSQLTQYRRDTVGFVFQFYNLIQNLTVRENVELATQICAHPLDADQTLSWVGLSERADNFPSQISGGEQQRVAIARAIAKNPKLLLCDEPTGALDYETGKEVLQLLQDICHDEHMTVLIITHNSALAPMAHKIIRFRSGKVISQEINEHPTPISDIEW